jgi:iron complex transport system substrate-binding protein
VALLGLATLACGPTTEPGNQRATDTESAGGTAREPASGPAADRAAERAPRDTTVSLSPLATRFVLALGAEHLLLGVDSESAHLPGLGDLPVVGLEGAADLAPDLVLLPGPPDPRDPTVQGLRADGVALVPFVPHDMEDVFELVREVGTRLAGAAEASGFEARIGRPLAMVGGSSFGQARPRVLALVQLDPLVAAGGHSFETDLIEVAGGSSITHGGEEPRLELGFDELLALRPDLLLVVSPEEATPARRRAALERLPSELRIGFYSMGPEDFWLGDPAEAARRLRALIEPIAREMEAPPNPEMP